MYTMLSLNGIVAAPGKVNNFILCSLMTTEPYCLLILIGKTKTSYTNELTRKHHCKGKSR